MGEQLTVLVVDDEVALVSRGQRFELRSRDGRHPATLVTDPATQ